MFHFHFFPVIWNVVVAPSYLLLCGWELPHSPLQMTKNIKCHKIRTLEVKQETNKFILRQILCNAVNIFARHLV